MSDSSKLISLIKHLIWGKPKRVVSVPAIWDCKKIHFCAEDIYLRFVGPFTCTVEEYKLTDRSVKNLRKISPLDRCFCFITYFEEGPWNEVYRGDTKMRSAFGAMTQGRLALYQNWKSADEHEGPETWS